MSNQVSIVITILSILLGLILIMKCNRSLSSKDQKIKVDQKMIAKQLGSSNGNHKLDSYGAKAVIRNIYDRMKLDDLRLDQTSDLIQLELANVKGNTDASILNVSINDIHAGQVSLFGLDNASQTKHGGKGLTFQLDVTKIIRNLKKNQSLDLDHLDIHIYTKKELRDDQNISIEKINVYYIKQN